MTLNRIYSKLYNYLYNTDDLTYYFSILNINCQNISFKLFIVRNYDMKYLVAIIFTQFVVL